MYVIPMLNNPSESLQSTRSNETQAKGGAKLDAFDSCHHHRFRHLCGSSIYLLHALHLLYLMSTGGPTSSVVAPRFRIIS